MQASRFFGFIRNDRVRGCDPRGLGALLLLLFVLRPEILFRTWGRSAEDCGWGELLGCRGVGHRDCYRDAEFAFGSAFKYSAGGGHFGVVAADGYPDVAFAT